MTVSTQDRQRHTEEPISVGPVDESAQQAWDSFVSTTAGASFYHLFGWRRINDLCQGHRSVYLSARTGGGKIVGVLPLVLVESRAFGRILCSMPFMNYGGPVASVPEAAPLLVQHAVDLSRDIRADYLELRCASAVDCGLPASLKKVSMTVTLAADPDQLWAAFTSKHRNNIRRAMKNGFTVRSGGLELLPAFYAVMERSWHDLGTPLYSRSYFENVLRTFSETSRIFVCEVEGRPAAVAMNGVSVADGIVEGMWAGIESDLRRLQPNYVLYWEMLRWACQSGYKRFHLGRSTADSSAEHFKERWLAEASQLYWYFHRPDGGPMPALNVDNPRYKLAIATWRRLPLWATRLLGPPVARLIP